MDAFGEIQKKLQEMSITPDEAGLERIPTSFKEADDQTKEEIEKLISMLEDDDDVVNVFHNIESN